jgi:hypothetical protein
VPNSSRGERPRRTPRRQRSKQPCRRNLSPCQRTRQDKWSCRHILITSLQPLFFYSEYDSAFNRHEPNLRTVEKCGLTNVCPKGPDSMHLGIELWWCVILIHRDRGKSLITQRTNEA